METNWLWNLPLHLDICVLIYALAVCKMYVHMRNDVHRSGYSKLLNVKLFSSRSRTVTVHHKSVSWHICFNGSRLVSVLGT